MSHTNLTGPLPDTIGANSNLRVLYAINQPPGEGLTGKSGGVEPHPVFVVTAQKAVQLCSKASQLNITKGPGAAASQAANNHVSHCQLAGLVE
jgi:hypothetical protein